jgi:hypothetical protein
LLTVAGLHVPVIPLVDVVGNTGAVAPLQNAGTAANVGVTFVLTVTDKVVVVAQSPTVGVKVYVPLAVLLTVAGLQVPVIPLVDVVGNTGAVAPLQIAGTAANVGVTFVFTVTDIVAVVAHCPLAGVNVYTPLVVLLIEAGFHEPVIPLVDVKGKVGVIIGPAQNAGICVNVGVIKGFTVTFNVVVVAHWPAVGVNVYVPLTVLLTVAGDHVPVIVLVDVVGNTGAVLPLQIAGTAANVGVTVAPQFKETQVAELLVKHPVPIGVMVITTLALFARPLTVNVFVFMFAGVIGAPPLIV